MLISEVLRIYWRTFFLWIWPFVVLPVVLPQDYVKERRCGYVVLLMAGYWVTEVLPLPITSMIPIVLFPLLSVLSSDDTCKQYFNETNAMFLAGILMALAIEYCGLHKRIALRMVLIIGCTHLRLTLGFFMCTCLISMWVTNTAAAAMMAPIAMAMLEELEEQKLLHIYEPVTDESEPPRPSRTTLCYYLGIAYSATIGGIGTYVGTGTNLTFKGIFETRFPDEHLEFHDWTIYNISPMIANLLLVWLFMNWMYLGFLRKSGMDDDVREVHYGEQELRNKVKETVRQTAIKKYDELGKMTWHEWMVVLCFLLAVSLWVTRRPSPDFGWSTISSVKVKDGTAGVLVCILLFVLPSSLNFLHCFSSDPEKRPKKAGQGCITWNYFEKKMGWGLILLLGGGFALAEGSKRSGLSSAVGNSLKGLSALHPFLIMSVVCFFCTNCTELTSNVAIANIILPVLAEMSIAVGENPIYLMVPATVCCSYSFMMPVGTPPNALVAAMVNIRTKDMLLCGIGPTIITYVITCVSWEFIGKPVFHLE